MHGDGGVMLRLKDATGWVLELEATDLEVELGPPIAEHDVPPRDEAAAPTTLLRGGNALGKTTHFLEQILSQVGPPEVVKGPSPKRTRPADRRAWWERRR